MQREPTLRIAVDQLVRRRRRSRQDTQPRERENTFKDTQRTFNAWPAHSMKSIAPGDEIARNLRRLAMILKSDLRHSGIEVMNRYILDLKKRVGSGFESCRDEVFDDLLLSINRDAAP